MRNFLLIRHAIAEDREIAAKKGAKDEERNLTEKGRIKMIQTAKGLKSIAPDLDYIATSPLIRAIQTAEILSKEYGDIQLIKTDILSPGINFNNFLDWAGQLPKTRLIALVGHEPDLGLLLCRMLSGKEHSFVHFKKAGAGLIEFSDDIAAGSAKLTWFLTPWQLRQIGATA